MCQSKRYSHRSACFNFVSNKKNCIQTYFQFFYNDVSVCIWITTDSGRTLHFVMTRTQVSRTRWAGRAWRALRTITSTWSDRALGPCRALQASFTLGTNRTSSSIDAWDSRRAWWSNLTSLFTNIVDLTIQRKSCYLLPLTFLFKHTVAIKVVFNLEISQIISSL